MTPAESMLLTTLQVSDPEIRKEIEDIIRTVVQDEINNIMRSSQDAANLGTTLLYTNRGTVEMFALTAMKRFWRDQTPAVGI